MTVILSTPTSERNGVGIAQMEHKPPYPTPVFFVAVTEFCERFSYYGMRAVLTIYMRNVLNFSEDFATTIYHVFLLLCYALPVFGGILADSFIGKYRTILYISIVYAFGNLTLSLSSVTPFHLPQVPLAMIGLFLMAVGTGGIKPCVVALGGEQFVMPYQEKQLKQYFAVFIFVVSVGNMFSTVVTPIFRRDVSCFGDDTCYPLAFGVPASLMLVAIVVFVCGKRRYKLVEPDGNILVKVVKCMTYAIKEKSRSNNNNVSNEKKSHWLDHARNKFDESLINDTKGLLRVLVYYIPIPMFFALYEQLGSRWTLQATRMNGVIGGFTIKPDQMQVANAILMFIFIPFFEVVLYPILRKCNIFRRPLQRMGVGGILAALSFVLAGIVEKNIENSYLLVPKHGETYLNFINTLPCPVIISENYNKTIGNLSLDEIGGYEEVFASQEVKSGENYVLPPLKTLHTVHVIIKLANTSCISKNWGAKTTLEEQHPPHPHRWTGRVTPLTNAFQSLVISANQTFLTVNPLPTPDDIRKSKEGNAKLRIFFNDIRYSNSTTRNGSAEIEATGVRRILIVNAGGEAKPLKYVVRPNFSIETTSTVELDPGRYRLDIKVGNEISSSLMSDWFELDAGGSYIVGIVYNNFTNATETQMTTLTPPNQIHMLWLLPQYVLMAWGEVLFIISGVEFSFTEAPASMKSVVQSCWHLTNAIGNSIVIMSAQLSLTQAFEFFAFAGAMGIDVIIFAILAMRYKYVTPENSEDKKAPLEEKVEESSL